MNYSGHQKFISMELSKQERDWEVYSAVKRWRYALVFHQWLWRLIPMGNEYMPGRPNWQSMLLIRYCQ
jgi:hypothetical protein